jgi:hypothetical protein
MSPDRLWKKVVWILLKRATLCSDRPIPFTEGQ